MGNSKKDTHLPERKPATNRSDRKVQNQKKRSWYRLSYEILYCLIATVGLGLATFDASYLWQPPYTHLTFRDLYLDYFPVQWHARITEEHRKEDPQIKDLEFHPQLLFYDSMKGIESHRSTRTYLYKVDALRIELQANGGNITPIAFNLLSDLQTASARMIDKDPFRFANKSGDLEVIKNKMRKRMQMSSGTKSFYKFWSAAHLTPNGWQSELKWFDKEIRPTLRRNYFRWIGEDGKPKNYFLERIDLWFVLFFWMDFLVRWILSAYRKEHRRWYLFFVRNWYEVFNLFPPMHNGLWRMLRVIPLYSRLRQNRFVPESGLAPELIHDNAAIIAEEISGMVLLNILSRSKQIIETRGLKEITRSTEVGVLDDLQGLLDGQVGIISRNVVPAIQPRITELVQYSIDQAMKPYLNSPLGPGVRLILNNVHKQISTGLHSALSGSSGSDQMAKIMQTFIHVLLQEIGRSENIEVMENQLIHLLEGIIEQVRRQLDQNQFE